MNIDAAPDFYRRAIAALDGERMQGIVVTPNDSLPDLTDPPEHVLLTVEDAGAGFDYRPTAPVGEQAESHNRNSHTAIVSGARMH